MPSISSIEKTESPLKEGMLRVSCDVVVRGARAERLWVDYPPELDPFLDASGNAWTILMLPTAVVSGEPLKIDLPVDGQLLDNLDAVQRTWASWYDWARVVPIEVERSEGFDSAPERRRGRESALFFTGGVDSFFSLTRQRPADGEGPGDAPLGLVTVHGFDISLASQAEFEKVLALCRDVAAKTSSSCIPLTTNLRSIEGYGRSWGRLSHGAALAGLGHLFSGRFDTLIIGSTHDDAHLGPWGSHPSTDPLFGTSDVEVVHDGAEHTRVEKTRELLDRKDLVGRLRVCWKGGGAGNCSRCGKCLRTMATIDLFGGREVAGSFDWTGYTMDRVGGVHLEHQSDVDFFAEIRKAAAVEGRNDIVQAIDRSITRSARRRRLQRPVQNAVKDVASNRYVSPLLRSLGIKSRTHP